MEERFGSLIVRNEGRACTQHGVPTDHLADMDGLNICRCQPKLWYAGAKNKFIAETRQHMKEKFAIMGDQIEAPLPGYPTWVVTIGMDLKTLLQSAEGSDVNTVCKLMPINGKMDSNSIFRNSKGI
jgi:hypothetical protein